MTSDLSEFRDEYHRSLEAFTRGDAEATKPLWSRRDDVTLANPLGPPVRGRDQVHQLMDRTAAQLSGGEGLVVETVAVYETGDLAYDVVTEHCRARLGDAAQAMPISLRVTSIFRREDGQWRIVHRHADPITNARPIQSIAQPGGPVS